MKKILLIALLINYTIVFSCTTFVLKTEKELVFGRNLDWVSENGIIVVNQRNQKKESIVFSPDKPISWTSKYGSISFNQFGKEFPFGGMNEKGLVIEIMLANAEYPETDNRKAVNELQWIQYQLDNCATLDEVIANDKIIRLRKISQELHFLVADKAGNVGVIEFKNGEMLVYKDDDLPFSVLENDAYKTSLNKYKNKENTRFTRATHKVTNYKDEMDISAIDYSFDILKDVVLDGSWSIVYDIKNMTIHFITKNNAKRKTINFKSFDFFCQKETLVYDLKIENEGQINDKFVELTEQLNKEKMEDAIKKNNILLPTQILNLFYNYYQRLKCS